MKKEKLRCISLKLDLTTIEKIESIMVNMNIRTYNEVLRTCLNGKLSINQFYVYAKGFNKNSDNIQSLLTIFDENLGEV